MSWFTLKWLKLLKFTRCLPLKTHEESTICLAILCSCNPTSREKNLTQRPEKEPHIEGLVYQAKARYSVPDNSNTTAGLCWVCRGGNQASINHLVCLEDIFQQKRPKTGIFMKFESWFILHSVSSIWISCLWNDWRPESWWNYCWHIHQKAKWKGWALPKNKTRRTFVRVTF